MKGPYKAGTYTHPTLGPCRVNLHGNTFKLWYDTPLSHLEPTHYRTKYAFAETNGFISQLEKIEKLGVKTPEGLTEWKRIQKWWLDTRHVPKYRLVSVTQKHKAYYRGVPLRRQVWNLLTERTA